MSDSIQIQTINSYTKNTTKEVGNFPIATGAITNCPTIINSVSSANIPHLILEPSGGCVDCRATNFNPYAIVDDGSCNYNNGFCGTGGAFGTDGVYRCYKYIILTDWDDCLIGGDTINAVTGDTFLADDVRYTAYPWPDIYTNPGYSNLTDGHRVYEANGDGTATCIIANGHYRNYIGDSQTVSDLLSYQSPGCPAFGCCPSPAPLPDVPYTSLNQPGTVLCNIYNGISNKCEEKVYVYGCTNPDAINYNPSANTDDGSCIIKVYGCTDPNAFNYNPAATIDNGTCIPKVYGCTNPNAINYNPNANTDNGTCTFYKTFSGNFVPPAGVTAYSPTGTWTVHCYLSGGIYYNFNGILNANVYWVGTRTINNALTATLSNNGTTWNGYSIQTVDAVGYGGQGNWSWSAGDVGIGFAPNPYVGVGFFRMEPASSLGHQTYLVGIAPSLNYPL